MLGSRAMPDHYPTDLRAGDHADLWTASRIFPKQFSGPNRICHRDMVLLFGLFRNQDQNIPTPGRLWNLPTSVQRLSRVWYRGLWYPHRIVRARTVFPVDGD